ncbi:DUF6284 family protein [Longispora albida]|uniref:DUF6284 family protein n=1 Tax=Longispora albida TaxID=203523 RepID=UPI00037F3A22|nr:DUF6284 family protein [Longispora albida]
MKIFPLTGRFADVDGSAVMAEVYVLDLLSGPTVAELEAIEQEMPSILADAAALDADGVAALLDLDSKLVELDSNVIDLDSRRARRARRQAIAEGLSVLHVTTAAPVLRVVA